MSSLVASSLEWLLKRALRFIVQRFLGRVLKSEVRELERERWGKPSSSKRRGHGFVVVDVGVGVVPFFVFVSASLLLLGLLSLFPPSFSAPAVSGDHFARDEQG